MKFTYTRCVVNRKVLMERQDVVHSRIRYLRMVRELREAGYTDETYINTSHAVSKCWQDSTTGLKIPFSNGNLRIVELHDPWVCTIITILVRPLVKKNLLQEWLTKHGILWSAGMLEDELLELCKTQPQEPVYVSRHPLNKDKRTHPGSHAVYNSKALARLQGIEVNYLASYNARDEMPEPVVIKSGFS